MRPLPLRLRLRASARLPSSLPGRPAAALAPLAARPRPPARATCLGGRAGTGKSHLLQAVCADAGERGGGGAYFDLAATEEPAVLEGYETFDVVCLDNLDAVAGSLPWNAAIFRLYTLLQDGRGRLIVSSTSPPAGLEFALPDLRSRLLAASVHQLQALDEP